MALAINPTSPVTGDQAEEYLDYLERGDKLQSDKLVFNVAPAVFKKLGLTEK